MELRLCSRKRRSRCMNQDMRQKIMDANDDYAKMGLRVLAVSIRYLSEDDHLPAAMSEYTPDMIEQKMTFVGLVVMMDPPEPEVAECR